jgi:hypothetical protein
LHDLHADRHLTAHELRRTAETADGFDYDPWAGTFPLTGSGRLLTVRSLGRKLTGQLDRWRGNVVLRSVIDPHSNSRAYWVHRHDLETRTLEPPETNPQTRKDHP